MGMRDLLFTAQYCGATGALAANQPQGLSQTACP